MRKPVRVVARSPYENTSRYFIQNPDSLTFLCNGNLEMGNGDVIAMLRLRRVKVLRRAGDDEDSYMLVNMKADLYDIEEEKIIETHEEIGSMATCAVNLYNWALWRLEK